MPIPKTLSASSLQVAELCMDRWVSEYMNRTPGFSNFAADTGTAVHGGLELFVKACFIDKTHVGLDRVAQKNLLISFYQMSYMQTFNTADMETDTYKDGFALSMEWFKRTNLDEKEGHVESAEVKETIMVPYNHPDGTVHEVPFNYIIDRVDQTAETEWEVIDYKTVRAPIYPDDLEVKVQARAYALALQIKHPEATRIKVTFDLLRHQPVSITFTRDDNVAFWRYLCATAQRLVDTDESKVRPTLNPECGYCVKKPTCKLLQKNIDGGGIHSLPIAEIVALREQVKAQASAQKRLLEDLDDQIYLHTHNSDSLDWETDDGKYEVHVTAGKSRGFDSKRAAEIMGPELFAQTGNMTLGTLDALIKDESIDAHVRDQLKKLINTTNGSLRLNIKPKKSLI